MYVMRQAICADRRVRGLEDMTTEQLAERGLWRTKGGQVMAMHDMDESHLFNTINMLRRKQREVRAKLAYQAMLEHEEQDEFLEACLDAFKHEPEDLVLDRLVQEWAER
jgi:hypothetical protein